MWGWFASLMEVRNEWSRYFEPDPLIRTYLGDFQVELLFSDGGEGRFDGKRLLSNSGPLLEPLRKESYFQRLFVEAGALCWPNGLELAPAYLYRECVETVGDELQIVSDR